MLISLKTVSSFQHCQIWNIAKATKWLKILSFKNKIHPTNTLKMIITLIINNLSKFVDHILTAA